MSITTGRVRSLFSGSMAIAVAMAVMNVSNYAFTVVAARLLGPVAYGALAAMLGLLLVVNVVSLGLQATGARRVAAHPERREAIARAVMRITYLCAVGLGLLTLLASPVVSRVLGLDSWALAALIAVTAVPLTIMGGQAGILQGERRWNALALVYLATGGGRLVCGAVALSVSPGAFGAMTGIAIGAFLPVVVSAFSMRGHGMARPGRPERRERVLSETLHNSHALLAFLALSNVDVVAARIVLDEHAAGLYAAGLILAKAVLFLPQFVVVIIFPSMSRHPSARRPNLLALTFLLVVGVTCVTSVALLPRLALAFVGGPEYVEIADRLWMFAALGTVLAMLQLLVYNVLARQGQRAVLVVWGALLVVAVGAGFVGSVTSLAVIVLVTDTLLFFALMSTAMRRRGAAPAAQ